MTRLQPRPGLPSSLTLRRALVGLGVLLVAINIGSAVWDVRVDRSRTEDAARREVSNITSLLAEQTASALEAVDAVLREATRAPNAAAVAASAQRLRDELMHIRQVSAFLVIDRDGEVIARTNATPMIDRDLARQPFFRAHRDERYTGLFLSEPYRSGSAAGGINAPSGSWRIVMSRPVIGEDGTFEGVVAAVLGIESFDRLYRSIDLGEGGFINLRTKSGMVITRVPDPHGVRGRSYPDVHISDGIRLEGRFIGWSKSPVIRERVLVAAADVPNFQVEVMSGLSEAAVLKPWREEAWRIAERTLLSSIAMVALIALAAWGLARREEALQEERRLADAARARLEQKLRQSEKMEAIGRLAGGIAHDFNNILGGILGYAEMLVEQAPSGLSLKRYAQNVLTAATRARTLVDQILAYSRSQRGKPAPVELGRIVAEALELVRGSFGAEAIPPVQLETELPASPLHVMGDATQLHQVVMNLCANAVHAMPAGGRLLVRLEAIELAEVRALRHGALGAGRYAVLTVRDSGTGMDEETLGRIFEPFFTTKDVGTGLGLSLVYGIVLDAEGGIDVASAPGEGSTFSIYLPRIDAAEEAPEDYAPLPRGRGERVLVVDDEEPLVALTCETLARLGYEPAGHSSSAQALAAFEREPHRYAAAIVDEVMPGLTGTELAGRLRTLRPGLPVVLVSGYLGPMLRQRARQAGAAALLGKPVRAREIATAISRALRRAA